MRAVDAECERTGEHPSQCRAVLISTLTKSAVGELQGRGLDIPAECIATLHAHAFRALGKPPLCVDAKDLKEWNECCDTHHRLSGKRSEEAEDSDQSANGDKLLEKYLLYRARCTPRELWPKNVLEFSDRYESWKRIAGLMDFSDVIHEALETVETAPGNPKIIFVDEAQDHDRAELRLIRKWAGHCEKVIIVGDPWQNLYKWRGADPEAFFEHDIPPENTRVLKQSYRIPRAVHQAAVKMISRCRDRRPLAEYQPRDDEGECRIIDMSPCSPRWAPESAEAVLRALDESRSVMVLASCEYLLRPFVRELRERGIPFWNPFAKDKGQWNPLHPSGGRSVSLRIQDYLWPSEEYHPEHARMWTWRELESWTDMLDCRDFLRKGAKQEIEVKAARGSPERDDEVTVDDIRDLVLADKIDELSEIRPEFLARRLVAAKAKPGHYALRVLRKYGLAGLVDSPRLVVGTVHSVKGAEAHTVFLCPDLSPQGMDALDGGDPDSVYRQFYVGMTRARERLFLCTPSTKFAIDW